MTSAIGSMIVGRLANLLTGATGANSYLTDVTLDNGQPIVALSSAQVRAQNVAPDIADQSNVIQYPAANIYCERIVNSMVEKFRTFSGTVQATVELRHSQDRLEGLQDALEYYAEAVAQVLTATRGDWGSGMFYSGQYQTVFTAVKHGGRNFLQVAKITFEIGVSRN